MTNLHLITETCQNVALSEEKDRLSQLLNYTNFIRTSLKFLVMVVGGYGEVRIGMRNNALNVVRPMFQSKDLIKVENLVSVL